jgi:NitT/TauT family transport system substrate-binding protein
VSKRRLATFSALVAVVVAAAASAALAARPAATAHPATAKLTSVKIALFPSLDYAPLFAGLKAGIWKKHGLDLKITYVFTGAGLFAAIVSGQDDLATNSPTAGAGAIVHGLPIKLVANSDYTPVAGNTEVLVQKDSSIKSYADLAGKTVATINLQGSFNLAVFEAVKAAGKDPSTIHALPMSPTDEPNALAAGRVDAVVLQDPFLTVAKLQGQFRSLGNPFSKVPYRIPAGAFWSSNSTIQGKASLLRSFKAAYQDCINYAAAHPAILRYVIPKYTTVSADAVKLMKLPDYDTSLAPKTLGPMLKSMKGYGWIDAIPSFGDIVWNGK